LSISEKRSLVRFLIIYLSSTFILFFIASWVFYTASKHQIFDNQLESLKYEAAHIKTQLRHLHQSNSEILYYPKVESIDSAIYDLDKNYIFGTYNEAPSLKRLKDKSTLYHTMALEPYYLGAAYLIVSKPIDFKPIVSLQHNIIIFMILGGLFFSIVGYFLGKLFIKPMRDAIEQMNHFIQDTTHELNTPISTILTNIEMIETFNTCPNATLELQRIEIASKTLSRIYDDLTYLNLNHNYHRQIIPVDISRLLQERMVYFSTIMEAKSLHVTEEIHSHVVLEIDPNDALRLIDNLLSNAIKYNKSHGNLHVKLTSEFFSIKDSGVGIASKNIKTILQRFKRANKSEGGFGIGLDIVNQVIKSYHFSLEIFSKQGKGTEVIVQWKK
jgi:two-component system OmpR family sensor kinase